MTPLHFLASALVFTLLVAAFARLGMALGRRRG